MYHITLTIPVTGVRTNKDAESMAEAMIEHLEETFNDNDTLKTNRAFYRIEKVAARRTSES